MGYSRKKPNEKTPGNSKQNKASPLQILQKTPLENKRKNQDPCWKLHIIFSGSPQEKPLLF